VQRQHCIPKTGEQGHQCYNSRDFKGGAANHNQGQNDIPNVASGVQRNPPVCVWAIHSDFSYPAIFATILCYPDGHVFHVSEKIEFTYIKP
jgi:hypothetical protein